MKRSFVGMIIVIILIVVTANLAGCVEKTPAVAVTTPTPVIPYIPVTTLPTITQLPIQNEPFFYMNREYAVLVQNNEIILVNCYYTGYGPINIDISNIGSKGVNLEGTRLIFEDYGGFSHELVYTSTPRTHQLKAAEGLGAGSVTTSCSGCVNGLNSIILYPDQETELSYTADNFQISDDLLKAGGNIQFIFKGDPTSTAKWKYLGKGISDSKYLRAKGINELPILNKAIIADPENSLLLLLKGIALVNIGEYSQAISQLDKAITLGLDDSQSAFYYEGYSYYMLNDYSTSLKYLDSVTNSPHSAGSYLAYSTILKSRMLVELGRKEEAIKAIKDALVLFPGDDSLKLVYKDLTGKEFIFQ